MHKRFSTFFGISALFILFILILDSKTGINGAIEGIELCLKTVLPSIFPFIVLSGIISKTLSGRQIPFLSAILRPCGIPVGAEYIFILGLLGGYPLGAKCIYDAYKRSELSGKDAKRMLGFCSNAGPSFIFGILGSIFNNVLLVWLLWFVHILSAWIVGCIIYKKPDSMASTHYQTSFSLSEIVRNSVYTIGYICAWIVLFRIVIAYLSKWLLNHFCIEFSVLVAGILELANGCCNLEYLVGTSSRFIIASVMLAFGGFSVAMQTKSVTGELGLGYYFPGKVLQFIISLLLSKIVTTILFSPGHIMHIVIPCSSAIIVIFFIVKSKISVDLRRSLVYNIPK